MTVSSDLRTRVKDFIRNELDAMTASGEGCFSCIEDNDCDSPQGHLFRTSCGETKCLHCGLVAWS